MNTNIVEILFVEDDADDAELTIRQLKKSHLANNLVHLRDGGEALDFLFATGKFAGGKYSSCRPKVILLDIQMPKMNGIEVLQQVRANERTRDIPVVMLTSSNQDPDIHKCYQLGANSYIIKPVEFDKLAEAIKTIGFYWLLLNQPPAK
ncbi:MAG TPA: response regulator [Puia sp.]|nr:response regulator [Puia sp.]